MPFNTAGLDRSIQFGAACFPAPITIFILGLFMKNKQGWTSIQLDRIGAEWLELNRKKPPTNCCPIRTAPKIKFVIDGQQMLNWLAGDFYLGANNFKFQIEFNPNQQAKNNWWNIKNRQELRNIFQQLFVPY